MSSVTLGSVALLWHYTSSEVRFLDLVLMHGAGDPGNPCYGVQERTLNFALSSFVLHFKVLCEIKAMLPYTYVSTILIYTISNQ